MRVSQRQLAARDCASGQHTERDARRERESSPCRRERACLGTRGGGPAAGALGSDDPLLRAPARNRGQQSEASGHRTLTDVASERHRGPLGPWVLRHACSSLTAWPVQGLGDGHQASPLAVKAPVSRALAAFPEDEMAAPANTRLSLQGCRRGCRLVSASPDTNAAALRRGEGQRPQPPGHALRRLADPAAGAVASRQPRAIGSDDGR